MAKRKSLAHSGVLLQKLFKCSRVDRVTERSRVCVLRYRCACECAANYLSVKFTGHGWGVVWRCGPWVSGRLCAVVRPCRLVGCPRWTSDTTVTGVRRGCFVGWFGCAAADVVASASAQFHAILRLFP